MYYIVIKLQTINTFDVISIYHDDLDSSLVKLMNCYIIKNGKYILKILPYKINYKNDIMLSKYKYFEIKKINNMYCIYCDKKKVIEFDKYPKISNKLNILSLISTFSKKKLSKIYKDLYGKDYIMRNKYLTLKSTYIKDIYRHKNINQYIKFIDT